MIKFGATGHQNLPPEVVDELRATVRDVVKSRGEPRRLYCSLAAGADQMIAKVVLDEGGELFTIIPCVGYEATLSGEDRVCYDRFIVESSNFERLDFGAPSEEAFWAAGKQVVDSCELLIAIWDGQPARGLGGTGDVVRYAHSLGKEVVVVWPIDVSRPA